MEDISETTEALDRRIHDLLTESDTETTQFCFEEEVIEQVMQQFYNEISASLVFQPPPSSSPPLLLKDDGKNGSCGASVSDSASTVMAGIDAVSSGVRFPATEKGSPAVEDLELDDEWLGRVLSWEQGQLLESRQWF